MYFSNKIYGSNFLKQHSRVQPRPSAVNMSLPAFAAERRPAARAVAARLPAAGLCQNIKVLGFSFVSYFRFLRCLGSLSEDRIGKHDPKANGLSKHHILLKTNLQ